MYTYWLNWKTALCEGSFRCHYFTHSILYTLLCISNIDCLLACFRIRWNLCVWFLAKKKSRKITHTVIAWREDDKKKKRFLCKTFVVGGGGVKFHRLVIFKHRYDSLHSICTKSMYWMLNIDIYSVCVWRREARKSVTQKSEGNSTNNGDKNRN